MESAVFDSETEPADLVDGEVFGISGKVALFQSGNFRLYVIFECTPGEEEFGGIWYMLAGYEGITEAISPVTATSANGCVALFDADNCFNSSGLSLQQIMDSALTEVIDNGCCKQAGECQEGTQDCDDGECI
ncbi:MAG: hypothetical protein IT445_19665 [Phycisphaeraceae bacterium]|nr:hypothetical protein [Phycisphaeraceae bacterium]